MNDRKIIIFEIDYEVFRKNCRVTVHREAQMTFDWDTELNSFFKFVKELRPVLYAYKRCVKHGDYCKFQLSIAKYAYEFGQTVQKSFDHWMYSGCPDDETGIMLTPNEQYTPAERAIWIDLLRPVNPVLAELNI